MAIKLTKNEQKVQKDHLKQYQRYLPTLQLKKTAVAIGNYEDKKLNWSRRKSNVLR